MLSTLQDEAQDALPQAAGTVPCSPRASDGCRANLAWPKPPAVFQGRAGLFMGKVAIWFSCPEQGQSPMAMPHCSAGFGKGWIEQHGLWVFANQTLVSKSWLPAWCCQGWAGGKV